MHLMLKFTCIFAGLGFIISFLFGLIGGVRFSSVLFTSIISTLISGGLGAGVHQVLAQKVPESLRLFQISLADLRTESEEHAPLVDDEEQDIEDKDDPFALNVGVPPLSTISEQKSSASSSDSKAKGVFGTHIMVDKIKIRNEPKLLAEAVRTMIARDDEGTKNS